MTTKKMKLSFYASTHTYPPISTPYATTQTSYKIITSNKPTKECKSNMPP